ncbi:sensor histidine kinase [Aquabacterium sp.]|uniref:sensor histidine kinase n=1 Tax=Aquabacterium sp. TaxID=1872578 RepID=UPI002B520B9E|nr:histidine kinase [Aquabacterium sp.]HSW06399.1 histidine kinase [Aquabacterium sp.]
MTPNPDFRALNPPPRGVRFDDRPLMAVGIPAFGLTIPLFSGLLALDGPGITPGDARWWAGMAWFVGLAFCIWWGNRWLLFKQREHLDWFAQPLRKLLMLVAACTLYTAPLTVAWLALWYWGSGQAIDHTVVRIVALTNVICVIFVTHAYETVFLIRERESDALQLAQLERSRAQAELAALKAQIDPHFLFNGLNTLGHLVTHDPAHAREFCDCLAEVYRYVLTSGRREQVPLRDELVFVRQYFRLLELRFGGDAVQLQAPAIDALPADALIVPLALQVLVENAVKHNAVSAETPLRVTITRHAEGLHVHNARRPRQGLADSAGVGLANLDERCKLVFGRGLVLLQNEAQFSVTVPMSRTAP